MRNFSIDGKINRTIHYGGREYLNFSGTAYLGMNAVPEFENLIIEGIKQVGFSHGSSRHSNVRLNIYQRFEDEFAHQARAEKAAVFSSGYLAGYFTVSTMAASAQKLLVAPGTHPSILPEGLEKSKNRNFHEWVKETIIACKEFENQHVLLLANAVNPLIPEIHDFNWTKDLPPKNRYSLLIDDSHAFGVLGKSVFGTYSQWKQLPVDLVVCGSLGKALAMQAGIVIGSKSLIEKIKADKAFRSASPPSPAYLTAFLQGKEIYERQIRKLKENLYFVFGKLKEFPGCSFVDDFPVISITKETWVSQFEAKGIIISSFPYPEKNDPLIKRIVLSAYHKNKDLNYLLDTIKSLV